MNTPAPTPITNIIEMCGERLIAKGVAPQSVCIMMDEKFETRWSDEGYKMPAWLDLSRAVMSTEIAGLVALPKEKFELVWNALYPEDE